MAMKLAKTTRSTRVPRWPAEPIDPGLVWVEYEVVADEFLIYFYFGGRPVRAISSPLNAPGFWGVAIMFGLSEDDEITDQIVGVQVIPMLLGAVPEQPAWAVLAWAAMAGDYGAQLLKERLPGFLDQVHQAVDHYWTPPPPMEEQLAQLRHVTKREE